jgi:catechol 2,3-dioxygenase-like lactoylglutathione lyase family enzyme
VTATLQERERLMAATLDLPPMRMSEIVLKTSRYDEMKAWYQGVLGIAPFYEHVPSAPAATAARDGRQERASDLRLCFIRLHLEHPYAQVLAIFDVPGTRAEPTGDPGLHHMQFRNPAMDDLFARYDRLKALGIRPHRTANHGPGTSFYYRDPDRNIVELSANNFATVEEYRAFFTSEGYRRNPSGIEIDPDAYIARYRSGTSLADLVKID